MPTDLESTVRNLIDEVRTLKAQVAWLQAQARSEVEHRGFTACERETLRALIDFRKEHGFAPTSEELAGILGISRVAAMARLSRMRGRGLVSKPRQGNQRRSTYALYDPDDLGAEVEVA